MLNLTAAAKEQHNRFVERVRASGLVWGLRSADGWAMAPSNDEDEDGDVIPFWSDRAYAARCAVDEWAEYEPESIPLEAFLEAWLPGMSEDGTLVGTNWNAQLTGAEVDPMDLREELTAPGSA